MSISEAAKPIDTWLAGPRQDKDPAKFHAMNEEEQALYITLNIQEWNLALFYGRDLLDLRFQNFVLRGQYKD